MKCLISIIKFLICFHVRIFQFRSDEKIYNNPVSLFWISIFWLHFLKKKLYNNFTVCSFWKCVNKPNPLPSVYSHWNFHILRKVLLNKEFNIFLDIVLYDKVWYPADLQTAPGRLEGSACSPWARQNNLWAAEFQEFLEEVWEPQIAPSPAN